MLDMGYLLRVAKASIAHGYTHGAPLHADSRDVPTWARRAHGAYTSLTIESENRGCMGRQENDIPVFDAVRHAAYETVFADLRFSRPGPAMLRTGRLQVHVFTARRELHIKSDSDVERLVTREDTLVVGLAGNSALMLAYMQKQYPTKSEFLRAIAAKGKINPRIDLGLLRIFALTTIVSEDCSIADIGTFS